MVIPLDKDAHFICYYLTNSANHHKFIVIGRRDWTWTNDTLLPKQVLYQAELLSDKKLVVDSVNVQPTDKSQLCLYFAILRHFLPWGFTYRVIPARQFDDQLVTLLRVTSTWKLIKMVGSPRVELGVFALSEQRVNHSTTSL